MTETEVSEVKNDLVAARLERAELRNKNVVLERRLSVVLSRLDQVEKRLSDAERRTRDLEDDVDDIGSANAEASDFAGENEEDGEADGEGWGADPHAFKVAIAEDKVLCYLPKGTDGTYFPAAMGGKHLGASAGTKADNLSAPFGDGTNIFGSAGSVDMSWARFGWYELQERLSLNSLSDKLVIAKFSVPRDPPESSRGTSTEVEGPKLTEVSLMDASSWKAHAKQTWKEFDASGTDPVTREVPIAHIANGIVTQLTMTPYLSLGDGSPDDWHADSEKEVFLSIDPPNTGLQYEMETVDETVQEQIGVDIQGQPIMRDVVKSVTKPKLDGNGQPIIKKKKVGAVDANGDPVIDPETGEQAQVDVPDLAEETYHQVHNFEAGADGGDTTYDQEYNRTEELVAVRVPKGGGAELYWRHIKFSQDAPCPPVIDVTEPVRSGNYVVFYVDVYEGAKVSGVCTSGTRIQHKEVAIPIINPELALQEKCVITGVQPGSGGITFQRESVLCVAGSSGTCEPVTIEAEACENT